MPAAPILIVDDNPANLKVARFSLEGEGYQVRTAADGEETLLILRDFHPSLILMDIQLPGIDGLELTRRLKADPATKDILVVAVTAYAMKGDREKAIEAGCDGYITKPVDPIQLPWQIAGYLGGSPAPVATAVPAAAQVFVPLAGSNGKSVGRILLVEDNPSTRKMFRVTLESAGYEVAEAPDCRTALDLVSERQPDLIIQDLILPDMDGMDLARSLRQKLGDAPVPIICVSGFLSRLDEARAFKGGFAQVLVKPVDPFQLLDIVRLQLAAPLVSGESQGHGRLLLVVDDDPLLRKLAQIWFSSIGFTVLVAADGASALEIARREHPAAIVSDVLMPGMDGFSLCLAVRRDADLQAIPVVLNSSSYVAQEDRDLARKVGASAFLSKSESLDPVARAVTDALNGPRPHPVDELIESLEAQRSERALWQLERQVVENARLRQRVTLQEAQLAVLAGVAESLAQNKVVNEVLGDVLASCLDMAGISKGALYLTDDAHLVLEHQIGFSDAEITRLRNVFGCEDSLAGVAGHGKVVVVPSAVFPDDLARKIVVDAGVTSLLLVPVNWAASTYGLMVLGARTADISGEDAIAFARVLGAQMGQAIGLARAFTSLASSEQRYRTLRENANDAIAVLTPDGVVREINRRFTEILGHPPENLIGRNFAEFAAPGQEQENLKNFSRSVSNGGGRTPPVEIRKAGGGVALVEFSNAPVRVGGEGLVLAIGRDVTEQIKAQAQLMVSDRMASIGTLAAGVAHEINNPLAAVLANLEFAVKGMERLAPTAGTSGAFNETMDSLRDARDASERVKEIVKDLKIFSRAEEDRRGPIDIHRVLDSTLRMAWNEIRHRARLVKLYGNVPLVDGNESRLGQVFLNLVMNAAQAIEDGHADRNELKIVTSLHSSGRVAVEVHDTGPGIPPEALRKLFTPFFTTKAPGVGTGLGLAICQRIVTSLGGEITVESGEGAGTSFKVFLLPATSEPAAAPVESSEVPASRRGHVLIVDDDPMIGRMVRRALSEHEVVVCTTATDALEEIRGGRRFDIILSDMMMPVVTGMDFYHQLRGISAEQAERIVFLTGGAFTVGARQFLDSVPNGRMEKPFKLRELQALINDRVRLTAAR